MLGVVVENYSVLRNQVVDLMIKSRKRKAGCDNCNFFNRSGSSGADALTDQYCCCGSDDDSCHKRPRESSRPKIKRVLVQTPISDSSLVREDISFCDSRNFRVRAFCYDSFRFVAELKSESVVRFLICQKISNQQNLVIIIVVSSKSSIDS